MEKSGEPREAGPAVRFTRVQGARYVGVIRFVTLVPVAVAALLAADGGMRLAVAAALGAVAVWSALYRRWLTAGRVVRATLADAAVLAVLGAATGWLVPAGWLADGHSWMRPFTTFAAVGYQYTTPAAIGFPVGVALCLAVSVATNAATPGAPGLDGVITAGWAVVTLLLARMLWMLLERAGRRADTGLAETEEAQRRQLVADGVRADESALMASLHDTAGATLLALSLGTVTDSEAVRRAARHDLATLAGVGADPAPPATTDLVAALVEVAELAWVDVRLTAPDRLDVPAAVAHAIGGAVREGLTNVHRHAGVQAASVTVAFQAGAVRVRVADGGAGFDIPADGTGRGLTHSIRRRMRSVGGAAVVESAPGRGTVVRLEWTGD